MYECSIHFDDVPLDELEAPFPPTISCDHDRQACDPCLKSIFEAAIGGGRLSDLVCPDPACRTPLKRDQLRHLVSRESLKL